MNMHVLNSVELKWLHMSFNEGLMAQIFWSGRGEPILWSANHSNLHCIYSIW